MSPRTPNFDRIAQPYQFLEHISFGRALERCRIHFMPRLLDRKLGLVLGDGDGRFVAALLSANQDIEADAVDTSAFMLRLLSQCAGNIPNAANRLRTYQANALSFRLKVSYDLVATHFFLDCLTQAELDALVARITPHLAPGALWVVSDFRVPNGLARLPARILIRALYLGFRLLTGLRTTSLPDHAHALRAAGFARIEHHHSLAGILTTELWQLGEYTASMLPPQRSASSVVPDPVPNPEPASPSLSEPDPGVFHHEPGESPTVPESPVQD